MKQHVLNFKLYELSEEYQYWLDKHPNAIVACTSLMEISKSPSNRCILLITYTEPTPNATIE